jgi:hypothetical protein
MSIILANTRPTCIAKSAEKVIVGLDTEKAMHQCVLLEDRCGHAVNEITHTKKSFITIAQWQGGVSK